MLPLSDFNSEVFAEWLNSATAEELIEERNLLLARAERIWEDPHEKLARNRYEAHDSYMETIRRIDGRLAVTAA